MIFVGIYQNSSNFFAPLAAKMLSEYASTLMPKAEAAFLMASLTPGRARFRPDPTDGIGRFPRFLHYGRGFPRRQYPYA